ncbi:MAG: AraC family ligand binding domain-containing protein, partial [Clostridia bacterium]|nr:AraC family ligand binding domain-containing protein [Clostridia bacterium]
MDDCFYKMREAEFLNPAHTNFLLHIHEEYEILLFFEGDAKYVVEEKSYNLSPGDIIIIRKHEMHRIMHNSNAKYHRFLIWISPEFFAKHNCTEYEKAFLPTSFNSGHKINSDIVHSSGLYDAI